MVVVVLGIADDEKEGNDVNDGYIKSGRGVLWWNI